MPVKSSASSDSSSSSASTVSTATKPQESSIAEDLPVTTTASQSKTDVMGRLFYINLPLKYHIVLKEKRIEPARSFLKKERDFFDDDEEEEEKEAVVKPMETPREERDTQHDAQSISIATDLAALSESEADDSHKPSTDNEKYVRNIRSFFQ